MAPQRCFRSVTIPLFVSVTFLPAYGQDAPLNGFDDYVNKLNASPKLRAKPRLTAEVIVRN